VLTHRHIVVRARSVVSSTYRTFLASDHRRPDPSEVTAPHPHTSAISSYERKRTDFTAVPTCAQYVNHSSSAL
jgi:hypothetical protein